MSEIAERLAGAAGSVARLEAAGPPPRARTRFAEIDAVDRGVDTPWSVQAYVRSVAAADEASIREAVAWCARRGRSRGFGVNVRETERTALVRLGLVEHEALPVYAMPAASGSALERAEPTGAEIGPPRDVAELVAAYGGWMADTALAARLVSAADLAHPARRFLVCRLEGRPVGCALVWFAAGTAYLSGIGVVADARGRGYGRALTAAAAIVAAQGGADGVPELVWMHATGAGGRLYQRMGFERVDVHLRLGP